MNTENINGADMNNVDLPNIWIVKTKVGRDSEYNNAIYLAREGIIGIGWSFIPYDLRRIERDVKGYKKYQKNSLLRLVETANLNRDAPSGKMTAKKPKRKTSVGWRGFSSRRKMRRCSFLINPKIGMPPLSWSERMKPNKGQTESVQEYQKMTSR